jgi:Concanavalin A-like lectin/glucanases superfamily
MSRVRRLLIGALSGIVIVGSGAAAEPVPPGVNLQFDGTYNYVEIPSRADFSLSALGLTVAAWVRPDALTFPRTEGSRPEQQFVHWLGKGETGQHEWVFRMYSQSDPPGPRANRISFYVFGFGPPPVRGCGSYFQDPLEAGQWIHVVGVADSVSELTHIYKNGIRRNSNSYAGIVVPKRGAAPLRMGTRDFASLFRGALAEVRIWNRPLDDAEVRALYERNSIPQNGLMAEYLLNDSRFVSGRPVKGYVSATWGSDPNPTIHDIAGQNGGGC